MLTALFADVHSNLAALQACLSHARQRGAERYAFLGDLVGYGPDPAAVIEVVVELDGAIVVKGNHDDAVEVEPKVRDLNDVAYTVIQWTRDVLSTAQRQYLASRPLLVREGERCFVHASAYRPEKHGLCRDPLRVLWSRARSRALFQDAGRQDRFVPTPGGQSCTSPAPPQLARDSWFGRSAARREPRSGLRAL